jgi:uncharacterized protein YceH (UPF0502 family)
MVVKLPRQVGRKEPRFMHLLSGEPVIEETEHVAPKEEATLMVRAENERIVHLEYKLAELRTEFDDLKEEFKNLKSQFE